MDTPFNHKYWNYIAEKSHTLVQGEFCRSIYCMDTHQGNKNLRGIGAKIRPSHQFPSHLDTGSYSLSSFHSLIIHCHSLTRESRRSSEIYWVNYMPIWVQNLYLARQRDTKKMRTRRNPRNFIPMYSWKSIWIWGTRAMYDPEDDTYIYNMESFLFLCACNVPHNKIILLSDAKISSSLRDIILLYILIFTRYIFVSLFLLFHRGRSQSSYSQLFLQSKKISLVYSAQILYPLHPNK